MDTKKLLDSIENKIFFQPIDGRVLIKPLKPVLIKKEIKEQDHEANKDKDLSKEEGEVKVITKKVPANVQKGVVLKVGLSDGTPMYYQPGDVVVYGSYAARPFELFKDSILLQRYEILGLWVE